MTGPPPGTSSDVPIWTPSPARVAATQLERVRQLVASTEPAITDTVALHHWSIDHLDRCWRMVWEHAEVVGEPGPVAFDAGDGTMLGARFFPESSFSMAEHLLAERAGASGEAIVALDENGTRRSLGWIELRHQVGALASAFRADGVGVGTRVAAWMPNVPETVIAMLAANAIGATFTSTSSDFGVAGVVDRFGQTRPTVLVAADGYRYGGKTFDCTERLADIVDALPTLRRVVVVDVVGCMPPRTIDRAAPWDGYLAAHAGEPFEPVRLSGDHAAYILYSSGTTGKPKCIVHRALGVALMNAKEQRLHCDIGPGDRVLYFTTCGWMMWNWLVAALGCAATIVLYDGSPFTPGPSALFDAAERERVTLLGLSAKYIDSVHKSGLRPIDTHDLSSVRTICSTGSPLSAESARFVYDGITAEVHLASISGGTDLCGCFVVGDPTRPVYAGEIQAPALGMDVDVVDDDGRPLAGGRGELVCRAPFPSIPLGFWGDDGTKFHDAYFGRFAGMWAHGDFASWTAHGGIIIHGRSDATLNAGGVRIGTAEIYAHVEDTPPVVEAVAVGQEHDGDTRIVLFVRLADGHVLDAELERAIRDRLRREASPRHVPAVIVQVSDVPRTRSGKVSELAVADVVNGRAVRNTEALANPECLPEFGHVL